MAFRLPRLDADPGSGFPEVDLALAEPNGLLAFGGDLSPSRLLDAYTRGIFPWYSEGEPILWWSPDPRMVLRPAQLHLGRRLRRSMRRSGWTIRADQQFDQVITLCADLPRHGRTGSWITRAMHDAYCRLHRLGHAHSIEVLDGDGRLVGGIYGLAIGRMFYGESMFSLASGGSQVAIAALARQLQRWDFALLDGQVESAHLRTLGFDVMPRGEFVATSREASARAAEGADWRAAFAECTAGELAKDLT